MTQKIVITYKLRLAPHTHTYRIEKLFSVFYEKKEKKIIKLFFSFFYKHNQNFNLKNKINRP